MMQLDGLIFDKDGTLFQFGATWEAWARNFLTRLAEGDRERAAEMGAVIGFDLENQKFARDSVVIAGTPDQIAAALVPHARGLGFDALMQMINDEAENAPQAEAVPLEPLLSGLKSRGLRLGLVTNDAEAPARAHLAEARVTGHFDFIAGCDSGYGAKPGPGQLLAFLKATGLTPERVAMVGDSTHDLMAGRAAGMPTIGVLTGLALAEDLAGLADLVLPDIGHIPPLLTGK
jgi:phosphoglycolate phosphatase